MAVHHDKTRCAITLVVWLILAVSKALCAQECVTATCGVPAYQVGHIWEDTPSSIMVNISIRKADFAPDRLICLAGLLKEKYANRKYVHVLMFSSRRAAKRCITPFGGDSAVPRVNWWRQKHADYIFDADAGENVIYIQPFGDINPSNYGRGNSNVDNLIKGKGCGLIRPKVVWQ